MKRLMKLPEAAEYIGRGRTFAFKWLDSIGAKVVLSKKCVCYDREIIDRKIDELRQAAGEAENTF